jgi:MSHA biogenesis protein MshN
MNRYTNIGDAVVTSSLSGKAKVRIVQNSGMRSLMWLAVVLIVLAGAVALWLALSGRQSAEVEPQGDGPKEAPARQAAEVERPQPAPAPVAVKMAPPVESTQADAEAKAPQANSVEYAQQLARQGNYNEAIEAYRNALLQEPANDIARQAMVELLLKARRTADAERALQLGTKYNPKRSTYYMQLARLQAGRNDLPQALDTLMKGQPNAKQQPDYLAFIASLLQRLGRHASAVVYYKQALALQPNSGEWLMGMGISLKAEQHVAEAHDAFAKALATGKLSAQAQDLAEEQLKQTEPPKKSAVEQAAPVMSQPVSPAQ